MSDNDIEDVSFLPGENLHRRAVYEPNILQKIAILACTRTRVAVCLAAVTVVVVIISLSAALARSHSKPDSKCSGQLVEPLTTTLPPSNTSSFTATNGEPFPYHNIRLPLFIMPTHYKLHIHPNISDSDFSGRIIVSCNVLRDSDFIVIHAKELTIVETKVHDEGDANRNIAVEKWLEYTENEQIYIKLMEHVKKESKITLEMSYRGELKSQLHGFYRSTYTTLSGERKFIATTHFEPTHAREAFPCFDEPAMKATFQLTMVREPGYLSLFNMPLISSSKVRVFTPPAFIESATFALEVAVQVIDHYEQYFGVHYPLPKQDLIAIPDFEAGAMENWGLITYRMSDILYNHSASSASNKQRIAVVIAHELAHQWFGNLVTMEWWDDLWLNEGFASYVEYLGSAIINSKWKMGDQFVSEALLPALYLDSLANSHPISQPVYNPAQINQLFDTISYDKGASLIWMLNEYMGEQGFKAGISAYLRRYQYSNACTADLWDTLSQAVKAEGDTLVTDISGLMKTWTEQMGYPLITIERRANTLTLSQTRFLLIPEISDSSNVTSIRSQWQIPFCYNTQQKANNKFLMKEKSKKILVSSGVTWIKGNCGLNGYYRVNYDIDSWQVIISQLHLDHKVFTERDRAGLLDDGFMLARAGLLDYSVPLNMSLYLIKEASYLPWNTFIDNVNYLWDRLESQTVFTKLKGFMLRLLRNQIQEVFWGQLEEPLQIYLRSLVLGLAARLNHSPTINNGTQLFTAWKNNNNIVLDVDLKSTVYRIGILNGDDSDWEFVWQKYLSENDDNEKNKFLGALVKTKDARLLLRLLESSLNKTEVRPQDTVHVISAVASSYTGQILSWRFVQKNWDILVKRYGDTSFMMASLIQSTCSNFDSKFDYNDVQEFFSTRYVASGERAVQQVLEKIHSNMEWINKYRSTVVGWLNMKKH
ncbi:endoplasmic reticulum aminopeptidase 1-like isoform X2 [Mya arenaria]|uniref:endoplasmic reticulum aminopeptidase 1-like isoform X2 n=1 Tax=Mya arenaria TaxID=6604 RepID=UPI0022E8F4B7|nr:endoplasmic reticulum aminopeptidase 1-like isoform X2 [Mya arenaria]